MCVELGLGLCGILTVRYPSVAPLSCIQPGGSIAWDGSMTQLWPGVCLFLSLNNSPPSLPHAHTPKKQQHLPPTLPPSNYSAPQCCSVCPPQSDAAQNSYWVCLAVSSALCRVAKLSWVPNFIMSSSARRHFFYFFLKLAWL